VRRELKSVLGWLALATGIYRVFLKSRAVIVLFHRVDDALGHDPISCTSDTFRAYCDFFRRYFRVVSLGELLGKLRRGDDVSCHLVITFDDGYRDNAEIAAAELARRGLPGCFFIATAFIGTDHVAPWDAAKGITSRWMSWDDVRRLHEQGFEIGAHTRCHVDLGFTDGEAAAREISGSKEDLERELGTEIRLFSYPFGRRENITDANRGVVRNAGFQCCLSAFGGVNSSGIDPFHLHRVPVSGWYISPYHFGFELMRQRWG
jgi:peptidoglycan/xylan/chitin deacetylase (PgdA/CDA1 family)